MYITILGTRFYWDTDKTPEQLKDKTPLPELPELLIFEFFWRVTLFNHSLQKMLPMLDVHIYEPRRQSPHLDFYRLLIDTKEGGRHSSPFVDLPFSFSIAIDENVTLDIYENMNERHLLGQTIDIKTTAEDMKKPNTVKIKPCHMLLFAGCV